MKIIFRITELSISLFTLDFTYLLIFRNKTYLHNSNQWKLEYYSALKKYSFIYNMNWWSISIIMCPKQPRLNVEHYHYMLGNLLICQLCLSNKARIFALANKNLSEVSNTGYWKGFFLYKRRKTNKERQWMELIPFRGLMFCSIKNGADDVIHKIVILQYFICKYENEFIKNKESTTMKETYTFS